MPAPTIAMDGQLLMGPLSPVARVAEPGPPAQWPHSPGNLPPENTMLYFG
jgi:hypothetical protein